MKLRPETESRNSGSRIVKSRNAGIPCSPKLTLKRIVYSLDEFLVGLYMNVLQLPASPNQ